MVNLSKIEEELTIFFSPLIFLLFQHLFTIPVTSYTPVDYFAVNCGFSGNSYTTSYSDQRKWTADDDSKLFSLSQPQNGHPSVTAIAAQVSPSLDKAPYTTARLSRSEFTYSFQVTDGQKFVRLFFYPASYSSFDRSNSLFSVTAGHHTLLKDFNASLTADDDDDPAGTMLREYCINVEPGHRLNITFNPSTNHPEAYAFINGIEIVSMPTNLYYTKPDEQGFKVPGQNSQSRVGNNTALEMVYRINVGGNDISADLDTGMFRYWDDDIGHSMQNPQKVEAPFGSKLMYQNDLPDYAAPDQVYLTAQSSKYNMTCEFEVDSKFVYMIRLHFCEFDRVQQVGDRVFQIFIADTLAEPHADVFDWVDSNLAPVYKDYAVLLNQGSLKKQNLSIKLQTHPTSKNDYVILNGIEIFKVSDSSDNLGGSNPDIRSSPSKPSKNAKRSTKTLILIALPCAALGVIVLSVIVFFMFRRMTRAPVNGTSGKSSDLCRYFSITEIRAATNNFDALLIIGVGGFGNVYKGHIDKDEASIPVAIKRLKPDSQQGLDEFQTEIKMLSQLRHPNLAPLIGYCNDENEMILVYEFMTRGTLREHLYDSDNQPLLWRQRLEICVGAARGLLYLHTSTDENKQSVIHRDVKSTNILLDEDWVAKVSDFGLSKIGPTGLSRSHITTDVKGSVGYLDPEYYMSLRLTQKSDVYSFGVVLLEVLCGRPPLLRRMEKQEGCLVEWVRKYYYKGEIAEVVDPVLKGIITPQCLNKFVKLALSCLHDNGKQRPLMRDVVRSLESALQMRGSKKDGTLIEGNAKSEDTATLTRFKSDEESGVQFSTSDGSMTDSKSSSKVTIASSEEEQALVPSGVFSELANPTAR